MVWQKEKKLKKKTRIHHSTDLHLTDLNMANDSQKYSYYVNGGEYHLNFQHHVNDSKHNKEK